MQNVHAMRPEVRARHAHALTRIGGDDVFLRRFERFFTELHDPLHAVYGDDPRFPAAWDALLDLIASSAAARDPELRALDHEREITPDWLHREQTVGYVAYVDRFAGTLRGVRERLGYLRELGVTYLHLMPLLRTRPEPNDGGYAVTDYGAVEPALGTIADLRELATELRAAGMSLCVDVVLNHTAREHPWAVAARQGDPRRLAFYRTFADRTEPDAYERTLPEVFPDTAPGNFTFDPELGRWVWTTFNAYQWDLDHANPEVFVAMAAAMLDLAAVGVDVLRLDAVPFLWKRMGTNCQNQPEVHDLLQAYRAAVRIVAPAVAFKAEAIVAPRDLVAYLGLGRHEGMECDLAYHNVLMVLLWSTLATRQVALLTRTLASMPPVPAGAGWLTYVRCHDDIGWAITDEDAGAVGEDAHLHRRFLTEFYSGDFPGSFARGARFQPEPDGEARISGTAASLAGLELALERADALDADLALRRLLVVYAVAFALRRAPAHLHGRRARRCATTRLGPGIPRTRTTRGGCTVRRWTGMPPPGARTSRPPRGPVGGAAAARRGAARAPCGARPRRLTPGRDGRSARPRAAARARRGADAAPRQLQRAASPDRALAARRARRRGRAEGRRARRPTVANRR